MRSGEGRRPLLTSIRGAWIITVVNIGERIRWARNGRRWSQKHLADQVGVTQGMVSRWETGEALPSLPTAIQLADILNLSLDELTNGHAEPTGEE